MSRKDDIKVLITEHQRRLQKLKEKQARLGIDASPDLLTEIEDIEAEIQRQQTELEILEESGDEDDGSDLGPPPDSLPSQGVGPQAQSQNVPGDTINATITGNISGQVAVGKDITQEEKGCAQFWKSIFSNGS